MLISLDVNMQSILKFHFLKASLTDSALNLIKNIAFVEENYEVAISNLIDRYENKQLIVESLVDKLFDAGTKNNSKTAAKDLESMLTEIRQSLQSLEALQVNTRN